MKRLSIFLLAIFFLAFAIGALWHFLDHGPSAQVELQDQVEASAFDDSPLDTKLLAQVNDEIESSRSDDHESALLLLIPATGLVGSALDERMNYEQRWLDELKVYLHYQLGLEVRYYLDYIEMKYRLYQRMIREREILSKRYGAENDFRRAWESLLGELLQPYKENLEDLFENNYEEIVKFNRHFNEKLKLERRKQFKDTPIDVAL